ncbi:MAG: cation diffusion facilitator family transporter [Oscillospiraceae bacterium]|nr:cation diffusion facilitator family transporter [Oscillospiraceae bacterium]
MINKVKTNQQIALKVSVMTIIGNASLSAVKLVAGLFGNSAAMIADAIHSLSDVLSTVVVIIAVKLSAKKADKDHQFGHERFECVAAIILSIFLFATGAGIGYSGFSDIMSSGFAKPDNLDDIVLPGIIALVAAVASIAAKELMYWYTRNAAKKINSGVLMADAWHHRSDALSSVGSFVGILGARLFGLPVIDSVAAIVICLFIFKVSIDIFRDAVGKMTDKACDENTESKIRSEILAQENVLGIDELRTRLFGDKVFVEVEISVDGDIPLRESHKIAHAVHDVIENDFKNVKHCMVHVNPADGQLTVDN